ncbi:MAG: geranylgeranyl reductase family protein [Halobacteriaceae archaeon]
MWDFAVVGAGPAGARFARQAARRGHDVVVFEQGTVGEPLACSGHVSLDVWSYLPDAAGPDPAADRADTGTAANAERAGGTRAELFQNAIRGARFHVGGPESRAYPFYKDRPVSNAIDRVGLDRALADGAAAAGADLREHHTVTSVTEHGDRASLEVSGPDGTETHEARLVAGCDGPNSRVRRSVGLPEPDELLHGVLGFDPAPDHQDFVDVHLTVPRFFAWRIPRGDAGVEYGLAARPGADGADDADDAGPQVGERFESLVADYGAEIDRRCSGAIPIGPPETVTGDRTLLIGDAAAQTKPFTGGGIRYGMTAADCAARTVDPADPATLAAYEDAWRDELAREIRLGHLVRRAYSLPAPVQRLGLRAFAGEIGVHMDRPTSLFSRAQLRAMLPF